MTITGTVVDKTPNLKIDDVRNALVQELKKRHADVRISHKGEIVWSAQKLTTLLISFFSSKSARLSGTKGIICFKMNVHGGWSILFEISAYFRLIFATIITALSLFLATSAGLRSPMMMIFVGGILVGFIIQYITLKSWFVKLIKKQIKKVNEATKGAEKNNEKQND